MPEQELGGAGRRLTSGKVLDVGQAPARHWLWFGAAHGASVRMTERAMRRRRHTISPQYATLPDAVRFLASCCDGARLRDGVGFRREHAALGQWLAGLPDGRWDREAALMALALTSAYRRQLQRAGFDVDELMAGAPPRRLGAREYGQLTPGWARDPTGLHRWRWWNGARWTHHVG